MSAAQETVRMPPLPRPVRALAAALLATAVALPTAVRAAGELQDQVDEDFRIVRGADADVSFRQEPGGMHPELMRRR
jgi:hypothetical protein